MAFKGGIRRIFYLGIAVFASLFTAISPVASFAISSDSSENDSRSYTFSDIDMKYDFDVDKVLKFSDVHFVDNTESTTESFGIHGEVTNANIDPVYYKIYIEYFNYYGARVATSYAPKTAFYGTTSLDMMSDSTTTELMGYSVSDIDSYKITISFTTADEYGQFTPSSDPRYVDEDYVIDAYDVNIMVNSDNTYQIKEHIVANFDSSAFKHGIIRKIPLKGEMTRNDGRKTSYRAKVTSVGVDNDPYKVSRSGGNFNIKIGDADVYVKGKKEYIITYTYNMGKDKLDDIDEFYFNIIGTEWDTVIGNVTFTIEMPKAFDSTKMGFSHGPLNSTISDDIYFDVQGNKITGGYNGILDAMNGLTVRIELEDGYFVGAEQKIEPTVILGFIIPLIALAIAYLLWFIVGRDTEKATEAVQFYPPDGMNSLDAAFYLKGKADEKAVVSLIVYLANKGYLRIEEDGYSYQFVKLKDYDGNDPNERDFLNGLFRHADIENDSLSELMEYVNRGEVPTKEVMERARENGVIVVSPKQLRNKFYTTVNKILRRMNKRSNVKRIQYNTVWASALAIILSIITLITIFFFPLYVVGDTDSIFMASIYAICLSPFILVAFSQGVPKWFRVMWVILFTVPLIALISETDFFVAWEEEPIFILTTIFGLVCVFGIMLCHRYMPKRTAYGAEMYAKMNGFKHFLETAQRDQIEMLVNENPKYYYDILSYVYAFGISKKYMKKFEELCETEPDWYVGSDPTFRIGDFSRSMSRTMTSATYAMTSSPSSSGGSGGSSGGGSSGGGSSGGGGGGGGGSSW